MSIARHYIEEPPEGEPPFGYCPRCDYALVDEHECRCGWNEYEAINDEGATSQHAAEKVAGSGQSTPPSTAESTASPRFCTRCLRRHARDGEAEERCQEVSRFIAQDHRRRGGEG